MGDLLNRLTGTVSPISPTLPSTPATSGSLLQRLDSALPVEQGPQQHAPNLPKPPGNPLEFLAGLAGNLVRDVPEVLGGLTQLVKMGATDIAGGISQAIPGQQDWLGEKNIQEDGYSFGADFWRAIGPMMQQDYASRYGFHGLEEFATQVYNNPLSYILDALVASGVVAKGTELGARAGLVSENLARKVLGVTADEMALGRGMLSQGLNPVGLLRPSRTVVDPMKYAQAGEIILETSLSPLKRTIQDTLIDRVLTRSASDARRLLAEGEYKRLGLGAGPESNSGQMFDLIEKTLIEAEMAGSRVLRPWVAKSAKNPFSTAKLAQSLFSVHAVDFYDARNASMLQLRTIFEDLREKVKDLGLTPKETNERLLKFLEQRDGWLDLTDLPDDGLPPVDLRGQLELSREAVDETVSFASRPPNLPSDADNLPFGDPSVHEALVRGPEGYGKAVAHNQRITPHSYQAPDETLPLRMSYDLEIGSLDQAANELGRLSRIIQGEFIGFRSYFGEHHWWKGLHGFFRRADGSTVEINFTTPGLRKAQDVASDIFRWERDMSKLVSDEERLIAALLKAGDADPENKTLRAAAEDRYARMSAEVIAANEFAQQAFRRPIRALNHPEGYSPFLEAVDELFLWEYQHGMKPFIKDYLEARPQWQNQGLPGPFTEAANRAFAPHRLQAYDQVILAIEDDLEKHVLPLLIQGRRSSVRLTTAQEAETIVNFLHGKWQVPKEVAEEVVSSKFPMRVGTGRGPKPGSKVLAQRLWEYWRERAVVAAEGPWDWRTMRPMFPQMPSYYPHIPVGRVKRSDLLANVQGSRGISDIRLSTPKYSRAWKGIVAEGGAIFDDVERAYAMVATEFLRHKEMVDIVDSLRTMGREVSFQELASLAGKRWRDEVLWAPEAFKRKIMLHSLLQDDVAKKMRDGMDFWGAAEEAFDELNKLIAEGVIDDLKGAKIYALPKHVADQATRTYFKFFSPGHMRVFYDGPMNLWRATVLGLNPRWLIFNEMGNIIFMGIKNPIGLRRIFGTKGVNNGEYLRQVLEGIHTSQTMTGASKGTPALQVIRRGFFTTETSKLKMHWGAGEEAHPILTKLADATIDSAFNPLPRVTRAIRTAGTELEQRARLGAALDEVARARVDGVTRLFESNMDIARRIAREGISPHVQEKMLKAANATFGDYVSLSPLERDIIRRYFIPFYPFYRHITKFTLRMPWEHPLKSQVFRQLYEFDKEMGPLLPEYLKGAVPLGQLAGKDAYWNVSNFNPLNTFYEGNPLNMMNPFTLKAPIQALTGTNDFGIPFSDPNIYETGTGMKLKWNGVSWEPFEGVIHPPWWKLYAGQFGTPFQYFNLQGYKNPTTLTRALSQLGLSVNLFDTAKYQQNQFEGLRQAATYGDPFLRELRSLVGA